jgi:hypothetical protein
MTAASFDRITDALNEVIGRVQGTVSDQAVTTVLATGCELNATKRSIRLRGLGRSSVDALEPLWRSTATSMASSSAGYGHGMIAPAYSGGAATTSLLGSRRTRSRR